MFFVLIKNILKKLIEKKISIKFSKMPPPRPPPFKRLLLTTIVLKTCHYNIFFYFFFKSKELLEIAQIHSNPLLMLLHTRNQSLWQEEQYIQGQII